MGKFLNKKIKLRLPKKKENHFDEYKKGKSKCSGYKN